MRVFVTGAAGFIGSATVQDLLAAGHQVLGLARNDANAEALAKVGVDVHRGDLTDPDSLVAGAKACDGVIHLAFIHDFSQFMANIETDRRAVEAMAGALEGSDKPLVIASGTLMVARPGPSGAAYALPGTEADTAMNPNAGRAAAETLLLGASQRGVRGSVVRLSPTVHGAGDKGFVPMMIAAAREKGVAAYVGDGANRWPAVHRLDAARLFRLAVENAAPGARLHGAAEEGIPIRAIAETIGEGLGVPVRSITPEEAPDHFGFLGAFSAMDNPTSSLATRDALGWRPEHPGLLADMRDAGYLA
ncbi:SDR family oxidoreductase [Phenylobacterium sp.]|jgi:nucleoside-diphosphate-sugar epimerase|uniref:SDR family oxidoreductase n=1 Tax=Phenylobacterium sp. TaxID=1871053 RepID=UPI002E2F8783|nr:SDR family oxidoreductase [Phenylobacterium sp.]HEX3365221.1 SDR family oxidoreductase [Phenylobacterium sp.]